MNSIQELTKFFDTKYAEAKPDERVDVEKARAISIAYCMYYQDDGYETVAVEDGFSLPILDVVDGKPIQNVDETCGRYAGIRDCLLRKNGLTYLCDHKVLSRVDEDVWEELRLNQQLTHYWLGCRQQGIDLAGAVWDIVLKPGISPKKLTKAAIAELESGTYCSMPFSGYSGETEETARMYGQRVLASYIAEPAKYFWRRILHRDNDELFTYYEELGWAAQEMTQLKTDKRLQRRNLSACKCFNRLCDFFPICSGTDAGKATYQPRAAVPEDRKVEGITPSRLACFNRCGREYFYRYVEKIEPVRRKYSEPLEVGSMVHSAIEIMLRGRMVKQQ